VTILDALVSFVGKFRPKRFNKNRLQELSESAENFEEMFLDDDSGGTDNRNIFDAAAFSSNPDDVECSQKVRGRFLRQNSVPETCKSWP
jgi:hypothetical protein